MSTQLDFHRIIPKACVASLALLLGACQLTTTPDPTAGLEFRAERYAQYERKQVFENCRNEALQRDEDARRKGSSGAYLTSARVADKCVSELGSGSDVVPKGEQMRISALAIVNYFKGGDMEQARRSFEAFKSKYPQHDLYFSDGSSFVASSEAILGRTDDWTFGTFAALNVNDDLKREIRRMHHWKNK
ncbi:hypothetical protein A9Q83_05560 [Alphaproteobacteria bacterium 46_93_T64]|nr:hypothetical protein A9Q83_05560 [Alphaproteobacteria bacterium 46_93_T64]